MIGGGHVVVPRVTEVVCDVVTVVNVVVGTFDVVVIFSVVVVVDGLLVFEVNAMQALGIDSFTRSSKYNEEICW